MCAIAGILAATASGAVPLSLLKEMTKCQAHRGPDGEGHHVEQGIGLGHRRLAIIDLSGGAQPQYNETGDVVVVFNGEIYNFPDLAKELSGKGHRFSTHSDTEVIVHGWEEWGPQCVDRFRGMFAFAVWDRREHTLFLARDRLGIKPLFYADLPDGSFIFASELKALLLYPGVSEALDPYAIDEYFAYGYVPEPRTIFKAIKKLPAGCTLHRRAGSRAAAPVAYWDVPFSDVLPAEGNTLDEQLLERLREAVRLRMISDVPLGAFLSGGVDSSAVVAMLAQSRGDGSPINTCSIAFADKDFDERRYADMVAERYGTNHRVEVVDADQSGLIDRVLALYDEPFADSSALPTYVVCGLARKHVTVALSGDGGDETLAGYRRYQWQQSEDRLRALLPLGLRRVLFGAAARIYPGMRWAPRPLRAKATLRALSRESVSGYFSIVSIMDDAARMRLFSAHLKRELQGYGAIEVLRRHARNCRSEHPLSLVQYLDMKTYLVDDILTKVDRASMAHGLEVRVPFLDHELVGWLCQVSPDMKLHGSEGKYLLKRALQPYLPREILYRRKMGFAVPVAEWFRGPMREHLRSTLCSPLLADTGLIDMRYVSTLLDQHETARIDNSAALWTLLTFQLFISRQLRG